MALVWRRLCSASKDGQVAYVEGRYDDTPGAPQENIITRAAWANPTTQPVRVWVYKGTTEVLDRTMDPGTARQEANIPAGRQFSWEDETIRVNCA